LETKTASSTGVHRKHAASAATERFASRRAFCTAFTESVSYVLAESRAFQKPEVALLEV
jgi:hypothetical protein